MTNFTRFSYMAALCLASLLAGCANVAEIKPIQSGIEALQSCGVMVDKIDATSLNYSESKNSTPLFLGSSNNGGAGTIVVKDKNKKYQVALPAPPEDSLDKYINIGEPINCGSNSQNIYASFTATKDLLPNNIKMNAEFNAEFSKNRHSKITISKIIEERINAGNYASAINSEIYLGYYYKNKNSYSFYYLSPAWMAQYSITYHFNSNDEADFAANIAAKTINNSWATNMQSRARGMDVEIYTNQPVYVAALLQKILIANKPSTASMSSATNSAVEIRFLPDEQVPQHTSVEIKK